MVITLTCPCGKLLRIGEEHAGRQGLCPVCGAVLDIPELDVPQVPGVRAAPAAPSQETPSAAPPPRPRPPVRPIRKQASGCSSWAIGLAAVGIIAVGALVYFALGWGGPPRVEFGHGEEVYYTGGTTETEARRLGKALQDEEYFDDKGPKTVQLAREGNSLAVSFVLLDGFWNRDATVAYMRLLGGRLSGQVFDRKRVVIYLCDQYLHHQRTVEPARWLDCGGGEELYYPQDVPETQARQLERALRDLHCFNGASAKTIELAHSAGGFRISLMVLRGHVETPDEIEQFRALGRQLSTRALDGRPVEVELWNEDLTRKQLIAARDP